MCRVPQGSILGPLLFIVYINDLNTFLTECKLSLYVDHTATYASSHSYFDLILSLQIDMATVGEWLKVNKLTLNVLKTKTIILGTQKRVNSINNVDISICNEVIE